MNTVKLHKGREQSVLRRHPWIFSRAIQSDTRGLYDGETVRILDHKEKVIGIGHFQNSSLAIRILAFEDIAIDHDFWKRRLENAASYRQHLKIYQKGYTEAFRLIHGEGDQLPGLIIDIYNDVAVLQAHSIGMHMAGRQISNALMELSFPEIKSVYCKSRDALPSDYARNVNDEWLSGEPKEEIIIHESGIRFNINIVSGQKTGFFLDQRENRALLKEYCKETSVLNCFSYSGGFTLYAFSGGAAKVVSIDSSATALEMLGKNLHLNSFVQDHQSIKDNVLSYLTSSGEQFDIVIIDPPAFAKNLSKRHNAIQAYKRLNMLAMAHVKKSGLLFTFSCSQVVDRQMFYDTVVAAAIESGRFARVAHEMTQAPDHPVSIFHPEGHYLKGLALHID